MKEGTGYRNIPLGHYTWLLTEIDDSFEVQIADVARPLHS